MSPTRILVVDDSPTIVETLIRVLQPQGYEVHKALNGKEALVKARMLIPDIILLDIVMPDMSGYKVCQRLKANPDTAKIGVIMLSAKGQLDGPQIKGQSLADGLNDRERAYKAGADDFLHKSVSPENLMKSIKNLLWLGGNNS
ncbi:MAG: response regulator [Ardenticatenaceae bacterium]|nr:response regulator [Anaerolineales bacterium]MCB9006032.1 response regulator [Ardenticatenaceae bacterium]